MSIVVGYVPTAEGRSALEQSVQEARVRSTDLRVVDLSRPRTDPAELQGRLDELTGEDVTATVQSVPDGTDTVDTLLQICAQQDAELLVIGLRRRTPVGKLILGAQAQQILLDAACPVLAVKPAPTRADDGS